MGRILAIDYGAKRTGVAVTDELQLIASPLTTVPTKELPGFLRSYVAEEKVDLLVVGQPKRLHNEASDIETQISRFLQRLSREIPGLKVVRIDERFTSKMAFQSLIDSGLGKKKRQDKSLVDQVSAAIILQSYMDANS